jgi:transglutaminase-like putative cysteine protease
MRAAFLTPAILIAACALGTARDEGTEPAVEKPYTATKSAPVTYDIDYRVIVTAPANTKSLKVWVPVPQDDAGQQVAAGTWSVFPTDVKPTFHTEKVFGNHFAYFEFSSPQGAQIIAHSFKATVWQLDWNVEADKVARIEKWPSTFGPYQRAEHAIVIDDRVKRLATGLAGKGGAAGDLEAVMRWVQDNMAYDHSASSLIASTAHALDKKRGDCSDYHGL